MAEKASQGQKAAVSPLRSAGTINRILQAADNFVDTQALGKGGRGQGLFTSTDTVLVKNLCFLNSNQQDLPRGAVIVLDEALLDEVNPYRLLFSTTDMLFLSPHRKWAVVRKPIKFGNIGEAQVSGVGVARVNVTDIDHDFAFPKYEQLSFESGFIGPVELLSTAEETGVQEMIVRFPVPPLELYGLPDATIAKGATGTVSIYDDFAGDGNYVDNGNNVTVYSPYVQLTTAQYVQIGWLNGRPVAHAKGC